MIYYFIIITIIFIIYSEISVTNILLRPDSNGSISFNFKSLFYFLINPLTNRALWKFQTLDINYIFVIIFSYSIYYLV
jgi:hypothetical protein